MGGARRVERPAAVPPAPADVRQPAVPPRSWRDKVRHAVDLTVAFVLLEDAEPEQRGPERDAPRSSHESVGAVHPHRKPLRPMPRSRWPGEAVRRPQPCLTPVGHAPATAPKRRSRAV